MLPVYSPPQSEQELLDRATQLAGLSLDELASRHNISTPADLTRAKGWTGQLVEVALGATAGNLPEPDFQQLGIELKTLPLNQNGTPRESTYVCTVPLTDLNDLNWEQSWVRQKLQRVLWLPIEADPAIPLAQRRLGMPLIWSPAPELERQLQQDWEEHMDKICLGELDQISARDGVYLQIRPKAANSRVLVPTRGKEGEPSQTLPRGFYLRTSFTQLILEQHFVHCT